jgi:hypothetical protein
MYLAAMNPTNHHDNPADAKTPVRGTQEFEIIDSELKIRKKSPFKPAVHSSIPLTVLDPEPLLRSAVVSFASRASGQALVSLTIGKPDQKTFNDFFNELKARVLGASSAGSGWAENGWAEVPEGNVQDVPPEFGGDDDAFIFRIKHEVRPDELEQAIGMLKSYVSDAQTRPFIAALEELRSDPNDEARLAEVARLFAGLGISQGAVLTYAPYRCLLVVRSPI